MVTNLRNRPVSSTSVESIRNSFLSLYHNLITGSRDFPLIQYKGTYGFTRTVMPFLDVEQDLRENTCPSPLMEGPSGLIILTEESRSAHRTILTPVLPERTELGVLMADHRNCIPKVELDGKTMTRVISPVFRSESSQLTNRWRVSDFRADGQTLMSVLWQTTKWKDNEDQQQSASTHKMTENLTFLLTVILAGGQNFIFYSTGPAWCLAGLVRPLSPLALWSMWIRWGVTILHLQIVCSSVVQHTGQHVGCILHFNFLELSVCLTWWKYGKPQGKMSPVQDKKSSRPPYFKR